MIILQKCVWGFHSGLPLCTCVLYRRLAGQDSPRRSSGSLYEIRMSACLLFQQPAFIHPICSSLGRLPDLEKFGGTDCNPVAMHDSLWTLICSAFPSKQQQYQVQLHSIDDLCPFPTTKRCWFWVDNSMPNRPIGSPTRCQPPPPTPPQPPL